MCVDPLHHIGVQLGKFSDDLLIVFVRELADLAVILADYCDVGSTSEYARHFTEKLVVFKCVYVNL